MVRSSGGLASILSRVAWSGILEPVPAEEPQSTGAGDGGARGAVFDVGTNAGTAVDAVWVDVAAKLAEALINGRM